MVDLSRLMQDAATLEVIEKSAIEAQVLRHDVEAYRACLGYTVSGDHDGRLSDGTLPNNGIAEALNNECRTLSAQNSAQAMQIDELERELSEARAELETKRKENDALRAMQVGVKCAYGYRMENGACQLGYPGCACMDDLCATMEWGPDDLHAQANKRLQERAERAEAALHEIAEEWAGAECGEPVTAQEGYAIELCKRMYRIATEAKK